MPTDTNMGPAVLLANESCAKQYLEDGETPDTDKYLFICTGGVKYKVANILDWINNSELLILRLLDCRLPLQSMENAMPSHGYMMLTSAHGMNERVKLQL